MTMSNANAIILALMPGAAEYLERHANAAGNMAWSGMATEVKYMRNTLYFSVALTAIATVGAVLAATGTALQYTCVIVATLGIGLAILSAKRLYDATVFVWEAIRSGERP